MSENSNKFTTKDLYTELFHCRDFELQHLWQRSVFLAGFMIALFTLYGSFVGDNLNSKLNFDVNKIEQSDKNIVITYSANVNDNLSNQTTIHYFAFFIGCVGIIISQLFIMMIKGSKRWYEQFEQSIYWFYENKEKTDLFSDELIKYFNHDKFPHFGKLGSTTTNESLFTRDAGYYSVSRINIILGQLLCLVWIGITGFHLFNIFYSFDFVTRYFSSEKSICDIFIFVSTVFVVFLLVLLFSLVLKKLVVSQD